MTDKTARRILRALLAEKNIAVPEPGEEGAAADARRLMERVLSPEASGALPRELDRALAGTFDALAGAAQNAGSGNGQREKT
jgi:hypothetical protein